LPSSVESEQLRLHIEAIENLESDKQGVGDDIKDRYALAKSDGFDVKVMRAIIKRRKLDREALREHDSLVELYEGALS